MVYLVFNYDLITLKYFKSLSLHYLIVKKVTSSIAVPLSHQSISPCLLVPESHGGSTRVKFSY